MFILQWKQRWVYYGMVYYYVVLQYFTIKYLVLRTSLFYFCLEEFVFIWIPQREGKLK